MKSKKVIIILLILIGICSIGDFILYVIENENTINQEVPNAQEEDKENINTENLQEIGANLEKMVVESLGFGLNYGNDNEVLFSLNNHDAIEEIMMHYYIQKVGQNRLENGDVANFVITKKELDEHFKKYYNLENINYSDVIREDCNANQSIFLKYDNSKEIYNVSNQEEEKWFCNGPIDYDFNPVFTKIYDISKNNEEYILTLTGIWISDTFYYDDYCHGLAVDILEDYNKGISMGSCSTIYGCDDEFKKYYNDTYEERKEKYTKYIITYKKRSDNTFYITSIKRNLYAQEEGKENTNTENLQEIGANLEKMVVESLAFRPNYGNYTEVLFSLDNQDVIKDIILHYYVQKEEQNRLENGDVANFVITKKELDEHFKKYYNFENINYSDIVIEDCNSNQSIFLKYDNSKEIYNVANQEEEKWFCNGPIDYNFNPDFTKIYDISKNKEEYILTLTGVWWIGGAPCYNDYCMNPEDFIDSFTSPGLSTSDDGWDDGMKKYYNNTYEERKEKYTKYIITFKKRSDNTFYITSIKRNL